MGRATLARGLRQLLLLPVLAVGVSAFSYAMLFSLPGDPARLAAGPGAPEDVVASIRTELGLDRPLPVQLADNVGRLLQGDLGRDYRTNRPVLEEVLDTFPNTLKLALVAEGLAVLVGVGLGTVAAVSRNRWASSALTVLSSAALSLPLFAVALLLQLGLSVYLGLLPPSGGGEVLSLEIVLPALTLTIPASGFIARFTKAAVTERLHEEHVRTAVAKGLGRWRVTRYHVLRNSLVPVISVVATDLARLLGGVAIVEIIFAWPGIGKFAFDALTQRNLPALQGALLCIAVAILLIGTVAEILFRIADPRIADDG